MGAIGGSRTLVSINEIAIVLSEIFHVCRMVKEMVRFVWVPPDASSHLWISVFQRIAPIFKSNRPPVCNLHSISFHFFNLRSISYNFFPFLTISERVTGTFTFKQGDQSWSKAKPFCPYCAAVTVFWTHPCDVTLSHGHFLGYLWILNSFIPPTSMKRDITKVWETCGSRFLNESQP